MGVSKYNSEGYYDPVVYEALTRIEAEERAARAAAAYRPLVYICSPYAGDVEKNTFRARAFSLSAWVMGAGAAGRNGVRLPFRRR